MGEHSASRRYGRLDDTRLAALVRKGDTRAFEVLYDRHHAPLLAFCRHMLGSLQEGEDALQQTFIRAHRALSDRPPPDAVRPWLFTIARNRCRTSRAGRVSARRRRAAMSCRARHRPGHGRSCSRVCRRGPPRGRRPT
jgi:DNA-directed RNA polymerase specialized sigma24 family protein